MSRTTVCRPSLAGSTLGWAALARPSLWRTTLGGSALGGSGLRGASLRRYVRPDVPGMERGRGAARSGIPATIRRRTAARTAGVGPATAEATTQDGFRADRAIGLEAGDDLLADRRPEDPLDLAEQLQLVDTHQ